MAKKKITNPRTHKAYELRQRTTKSGQKGQIKGLYKSKNSKRSLDRFAKGLRYLSER